MNRNCGRRRQTSRTRSRGKSRFRDRMQSSAGVVISLSMGSNPTVTAIFIPDQRHFCGADRRLGKGLSKADAACRLLILYSRRRLLPGRRLWIRVIPRLARLPTVGIRPIGGELSSHSQTGSSIHAAPPARRSDSLNCGVNPSRPGDGHSIGGSPPGSCPLEAYEDQGPFAIRLSLPSRRGDRLGTRERMHGEAQRLCTRIWRLATWSTRGAR